jgi:hypothetical protein
VEEIAMMRLNDRERRLWVLNHYRLYERYKASGLSEKSFIRRHKKTIDAEIRKEMSGVYRLPRRRRRRT